jgi:hypothetical protein
VKGVDDVVQIAAGGFQRDIDRLAHAETLKESGGGAAAARSGIKADASVNAAARRKMAGPKRRRVMTGG